MYILFMHCRETKILYLSKIFITILSCDWNVLKRNSLKDEQFRGKYTKLQIQRYTNDPVLSHALSAIWSRDKEKPKNMRG